MKKSVRKNVDEIDARIMSVPRNIESLEALSGMGYRLTKVGGNV